MVTEYGMSDKLGPRTFGDRQELVFLGREISEQRDYGEKIADIIDDEVSRIIQEAYEAANKVLTENKPKLVRIAQKLVIKETLEGKELEALFSEPVTSPMPEMTAVPTPEPAVAETKTKPGKARTMLRPLPKQAPAASD
jgi:cell division protease FtsH